jgi:hypothetical protein
MIDPNPTDPAGHAGRFAADHADLFESYVRRRMHALGIPEHQIGASDHVHGIARRVFFPHEGTGGGVDPIGRISVDSGVLNPDLLAGHPEAAVSSTWARASLRDRIDAILAHEHAEGPGATHEDAIAHAADTALPISEGARHILRVIAGREQPSGREP